MIRRKPMPIKTPFDLLRLKDKTPPPEGLQIAEHKSKPDMVTVTGFNYDDVLFRSDKVGCVQWRDGNGKLIALLLHVKPGVWGFSRAGDEDWPHMLALHASNDDDLDDDQSKKSDKSV